MMRGLLILLALLVSWTPAKANDDMVEFCVAVLLVMDMNEEVQLWRSRWELDRALITEYYQIVSLMRDEDRIPDQEIREAAEECVQARKEVNDGSDS